MERKDLTQGLVVVTRDGRVRLVTDNDVIYNLKKGTPACMITDYKDDLTSKVDEKFDIMQVFKNYKMDTVIWTRQDAVLDDAEIAYLGGFLAPFGSNVAYVVKKSASLFGMHEALSIYFTDGSVINLPSFVAGTYYTGMKLNKTYTLDDLGL